ncbi:MAG: FtsQ-type POTRA domain-containing protein [Acidimicrobiales bacterium]
MAIDPRIRARRVAVRRQEGRRRLRFLLGAVGLIALAVAAWGLTRTPLLDLDHVRYEGVADADAAEVAATTGLEPGTAMFDLDLGGVERDLMALPWVSSATASRDWPGTVRIVVVAREAVAVVGAGSGPAFLADVDGVLIRPASPDSGLPRVAVEPTAGLGGTQVDALPAIEVAIAVPDDLRPWVDAVTIDGGSGEPVHLGLDLIGSAEAVLGSGDFIDDKLAAVRAVLQRVELACLDVIDVAVADSPVTTRDEACEGGVDG